MVVFILSVLAAAQPAIESAPPAEKPAAASCVAHKLEIEVSIPGKEEASTVKICDEPGRSEAEWAETLRDAAEKVRSSEGLPQPVKEQILAAIDAELARLSVPAAAPSAASEAPVSSAIATPAPPPPAQTSVPPAPPAASSAAPAAPSLTILCHIPEERGRPGRCHHLERRTLLTVRADEPLQNGASLRFVRRGDERAVRSLKAMRRGQEVVLRLPDEVCAGVGSSRVEIQILPGGGTRPPGRPVESIGPLPLDC